MNRSNFEKKLEILRSYFGMYIYQYEHVSGTNTGYMIKEAVYRKEGED